MMQLQKNTWHEGLLEEGKVKDLMDKLPEMLRNFTDRFLGCFQRSEQTFNANAYLKGLLSNLKGSRLNPLLWNIWIIQETS